MKDNLLKLAKKSTKPGTNYAQKCKKSMMVNQTGNRVHRHRTSGPVLDVDISKKLIADRGSYCKHTINIRLILANPRIRKHRKSRIIVSKMPNIKRLRVLRTHLTGYTGRLIAIISPRFLIAENLIIDYSTSRINLSRTLSKNFLVLHSLFADIGKHRPIVVKAILTRPETFKTLLIGVIVTSDHNANDETMLCERLGEIRMSIRSDRHTGNSTLCSLAGSRSRLLHNLIDINGDTVTTEIFGTLKTGIRRSHTKMRLENFDIARTAASILLIELLNLKRHTELINRSGSGITGSNSNQTGLRKIITKLCLSRDTQKIQRINRTRNRINITRDSNFRKRTRLIKTSIITSLISLNESPQSMRRNTISNSKRKTITDNRIVTSFSNRNRNIRAFLRRRQTTRKIVVILGSLIRQTTFANIGNKSTGIHTGYSSIIDGNDERIR
nr:MAG TPA: hypothetical protein [Microviridae sp.]